MNQVAGLIYFVRILHITRVACKLKLMIILRLKVS